MSARFDGKIAIVTGAASGIGAAVATRLAGGGARVVVADRNADAAKGVADHLVAGGGNAISIAVDVSVPDEVAALVGRTLDHFGGLHLAVNNAGVATGEAAVPDISDAEWQRVIAVNLGGVFNSLKHEIPAILASGGGAIVNVSSMYGKIGFPNYAPIAASKHAIIGLTRSAALEFADRGIRINTLCPGLIDTPMSRGGADHSSTLAAIVPSKRMGAPDEAASAIAFLLSDDASYINASELQVDAGIAH